MTARLPEVARGGAAIASRFEIILNNLELLAGNDDRMREIVAARRDLTAEIGAAASFFDGDSFPSALRADARRRLSVVRHVVSLHQATWPIVSARENPEAYRRSAQGASQALRDFIAWIRAQRLEIGNDIGGHDGE